MGAYKPDGPQHPSNHPEECDRTNASGSHRTSDVDRHAFSYFSGHMSDSSSSAPAIQYGVVADVEGTNVS